MVSGLLDNLITITICSEICSLCALCIIHINNLRSEKLLRLANFTKISVTFQLQHCKSNTNFEPLDATHNIIKTARRLTSYITSGGSTEKMSIHVTVTRLATSIRPHHRLNNKSRVATRRQVPLREPGALREPRGPAGPHRARPLQRPGPHARVLPEAAQPISAPPLRLALAAARPRLRPGPGRRQGRPGGTSPGAVQTHTEPLGGQRQPAEETRAQVPRVLLGPAVLRGRLLSGPDREAGPGTGLVDHQSRHGGADRHQHHRRVHSRRRAMRELLVLPFSGGKKK